MLESTTNDATSNNPAISIIMTTLNAERYLKESIESIQKQTLNDIEIVCVDGGSTDNTCKIISDLIKSDPRIKLFNQTRPGIGAAKNEGIELSSGRYISFLDADDFYIDPSALEKMYHACMDNDVKICGAYRIMINEDGSIIKELLHRKDCRRKRNGILLHYEDKQYDYHFHSYIYERKMIVESDARFAEVKAYDDTHFFIRAMLASHDFYVVPVEMYGYRCGPKYKWGCEKTIDLVYMLTDQLTISKRYSLSKLHWLTVQRFNYEYYDNIIKNIENGCDELLEKLIIANNEVDSDLLDQVEDGHLIKKEYLEPMLHYSLENMMLITNTDERYDTKYILRPLWLLDHEDIEINRNIIKKAMICLRYAGLKFTIKLFFIKLRTIFRGK